MAARVTNAPRRHHRVSLVETRQKMRMLTLKNQGQNSTSGEGYVRSRGDPDESCCTSVNASWQEKHIGTKPTAPSLFCQELETKFDLI